MKEIYPEYADEVAFYGVGVDPSESIEELETYSDSQGVSLADGDSPKGYAAKV